MNKFFSSRSLLAAAVAIGTLAAASAAQARTDVVVSVGIGGAHAPVYVQPAPVYVQPRPVAYQAQHRWYNPRGAWGDADRDGVPNIHDRDSRFYERVASHNAGPWGDLDRDGVPNRYDRAPTNRYRS